MKLNTSVRMECPVHVDQTNDIFNQSVHLARTFCSNECKFEIELVQHHVGTGSLCFGDEVHFYAFEYRVSAPHNPFTTAGSGVEP